MTSPATTTPNRYGSFRARSAGLLAGLALFNAVAWAWAILSFRNYPALLGTAALAYTFGLRHAFDADHIAAIDNVTRKMVQNGTRPVAVGFCFSLGHSSIVVALSVAIAATAAALQNRFEAFKDVGGVVGTLVSALFLFAIAAANIAVLGTIWRAFRAARAGERIDEEDIDLALANRGLMGRIFRRCFRTVSRSWHMYFIGLLFGLGFDTATEIGLLGISATQAAQGLSVWSILVFPALFTAGMTLVDSGDSLLMVGAYGWAFVKPIRKLYYNLTITVISVLVAIVVGGLEALNLLGDQLGLSDNGGFWGAIGAINDHFGTLGYLIIGIFAACWLLSALVYRLKGYDTLEAAGD
jgi:high-affinity nickel-transport protein